MKVTAVILAAGQGTRMKSSLPKMLHTICGRPMLAYALAAVGKVAADLATKELDERQLAALHRAVEAAAAGEPFPPALPAPAPGETTLAEAAAAEQERVIECEAVVVERPALSGDGSDPAAEVQS